MITVKIILRKDKSNKLGEHQLYLRITKNRRTKYMGLKIYLKVEHWDEKNCRVRKSFPNSQRVNNYLASKYSELQASALDLSVKSNNFILEDVRGEMKGKMPQSFTKYSQQYLSSLNSRQKISTYRKVKSILKKVTEYTNSTDLMFNQLTVSWLKLYEEHLKAQKNNRINTIGSNFKTIGVIINAAINEGLITEDLNPFRRFKIPHEKTSKTFLTEDELRKIEKVQLVKGSMKDLHRNMFVFAAYAGGLRISDILMLKWANFNGERILMSTKKTGSTVSIKLPTKALEILRIYHSPNVKPEEFIFPALDNEADYSDKHELFADISSASAYTNDDLKEITIAAKVDKRISFHTSRHTFATIALKKGMRIEYVSKLMGHSSIAMTQVYAKIVDGELDKAMEVFN